MRKCNLAFGRITALVLLLFAQGTHAFIGPPTLSPEIPRAGETVFVNITNGGCDAIIETPGFPRVNVNGNSIHVLLASAHAFDGLFCIFPVLTSTYPIGSYPAGVYTVEIDRQYQGAFGDPVIEALGTLPLTVQGTALPVSAPALGAAALAGVIFLLLISALLALNRRATCWLSVVLLCAPCIRFADAETPVGTKFIEVLVTGAPSAPTADDIVDYYRQSPPVGDPPLQGLMVESPLYASYLTPIRANGDFLERLRTNPESPRSMLERYVIVAYRDDADIERALSALRADPYVDAAYISRDGDFSSAGLVAFSVGSELPNSPDEQYGRDDLNVDAAWQIAGGYALIGDVDTGLYMNHPALRQFSGSQFIGGNFIPVASWDIGQSTSFVGYPDYSSANVDELNSVQVPAGGSCDTDGTGYAIPIAAGHGTHVAGLIGANSQTDIGVQGICKHCGIAMWKIIQYVCQAPATRPSPVRNSSAVGPAIALASETGAQVINLSFGNQEAPSNFCETNPKDSWCLGIGIAVKRDIAIVASSGNNRIAIQFPAKDDRVIAAGGFQQSLAIWNDSPGSTTNCPHIPNLAPGAECGSDYTNIAGGPKQELMGSAKSVLSTTYPQINWNGYVDCGDGFPGPGWGNGVGLCTGTSMSAPQISGVVGILRSINPLVPVGKPTFNPLTDPTATLRYVLASTTFEAQAGHPWDSRVGYGRPDAAAAARKLLGKVAGITIRNRATPLFRLYSANAKDYADTTSPQVAFALMFNHANTWQPDLNAALVPGYPQVPHDPADGTFPSPRAAVYVLATEVKPRAEWPALRPLYQMDKDFANGEVDDYLLVTTATHIEQAHAAGYNLRTIQGYIYEPCTPEPYCIPPGAQKFWRACRTADNDCATFLDSERTAFEANGYTSAFPSGSKLLGYAYPATDTDHDGLPDGFEYAVGTSPTRANSDNDTAPDAAELPMIGVPVSDPCGGVGSSGALFCGADSIFRNGFDGYPGQVVK